MLVVETFSGDIMRFKTYHRLGWVEQEVDRGSDLEVWSKDVWLFELICELRRNEVPLQLQKLRGVLNYALTDNWITGESPWSHPSITDNDLMKF